MPKKMKLDAVDACFERLSLRQPDPQTELDFTSPFTLLVAVVLSAQATDVGVNDEEPRPASCYSGKGLSQTFRVLLGIERSPDPYCHVDMAKRSE